MRRLLLVLVLLAGATALWARTQPYDLVIRDARIVDGTGTPW
jgi:hypothetical protein